MSLKQNSHSFSSHSRGVVKKVVKTSTYDDSYNDTSSQETKSPLSSDSIISPSMYGINEESRVIEECESFCVTYLNLNSPLKSRFEEEITCMQKFLRSNEALTASLRELYTHRTYLNNATAIVTKFDILHQKYHQLLKKKHFYIDPVLKLTIDGNEDYMLNGCYRYPNEIVDRLQEYDAQISRLEEENEEYHKHIKFMQESINTIQFELQSLPKPPERLVEVKVDLETPINEKTIIPLINYLMKESKTIHSIEYYNRLTRKWPYFQQICTTLKQMMHKQNQIDSISSYLEKKFSDIPNSEMKKRFEIITNISKQTCLYESSLPILDKTYEKLVEIQQNVDEEVVKINNELDYKIKELKNKVDSFGDVLNNNRLFPEISQNYFKPRRAISDWLSNKKKEKTYNDVSDRLSEINILMNNYYNDFYRKVSAECEKYLTDNTLYSKCIQYQEVEEQFEILQNYTSKNYDHVYVLYEQLLPTLGYKFTKNVPLASLIVLRKEKKGKGKGKNNSNSNSNSSSDYDDSENNDDDEDEDIEEINLSKVKHFNNNNEEENDDNNDDDEAEEEEEEEESEESDDEEEEEEEEEELIEIKSNVNNNNNINENEEENDNDEETETGPSYFTLLTERISSFFIFILLSFKKGIIKTYPLFYWLLYYLFDVPMFYIMYIPCSIYFAIYYTLFYDDKRSYLSGDLVYYYKYIGVFKWWSCCRVLEKKKNERTYKIIDINTGCLYEAVDPEYIFCGSPKEFFSSTTVGKTNKRVFLDKNFSKYYKTNPSYKKAFNMKEKVEFHINKDRWIEGNICEYDKNTKRYTVTSCGEKYSYIPNYALRSIYKVGSQIEFSACPYENESGKVSEYIGDGLYLVKVGDVDKYVSFSRIMTD